MEFDEVIRKRRMVRHFTQEPVSPEAIERILDAACHAPSAGYTQGQSFVVVTRPEMKAELAELCGEKEMMERGWDPWISEAPVLVVPCTSEEAYHNRYREPDKIQDDGKEIEWPVPYWFMDVGCAVENLLLAAVDEGLAAGFAGTGDLDALRTSLGIPGDVTPVGIIPIGHGAPDMRSPSLKRGRKASEDYVHREKW